MFNRFLKLIIKRNYKNGFTLLFAVIIIGVVLSVGLAIYTILMKEFKLSAFARESQTAFYAADSGYECMIYWDIKRQMVSSTTPKTISCANQNVTVGGATTSTISLNFENGTCALVTIYKDNPAYTKIESKGYNTCNPSSAYRLERAVRATY